MHEHDEDSRVTSPRDERYETKVEHGRQLAMDSILQEACRGMMSASGGEAARGPHATVSSRRRVLIIAGCIAASIFGVWVILWGTGGLRPWLEIPSSSAETVAFPPGEHEPGSVAPIVANPDAAVRPSKQSGDATPPKSKQPGKSVRAENPPKKTELKGNVANVVPGPEVKLKRQEIPEPNANGKILIPESADPADIRALVSAQAMIDAEKKLAEMLKAGLIKGIDSVLPFSEIASWPYEDGLKGMPEKLKRLDGKRVLMTGFMLPIDHVENIKEFLLVQSLWSCCYGEPPDINGTVRVIMKGKNRTDYKFDPLELVGTFRIEVTIEDGFCVGIFQLEVERVEVIQ